MENAKWSRVGYSGYTHICLLVFLSALTAGAGLNWQYEWLVRFVGHSIDALLTKSISVVKNMSVMASEPTRWWFSIGMEKENGIPLEPVRLFVLPKKISIDFGLIIIVCRRARVRSNIFRVWAAYNIAVIFAEWKWRNMARAVQKSKVSLFFCIVILL